MARRVEAVVVAVISPTLQAFLTAALALSGLSFAHAEDDEVSLQYSHYEEGQRHLLDSYKTLKLEPIHVDSWNASESITFKDRIKLGFSFNQDTWSGATPLTTAPAAAMYLLQSGASSAISENFFIDKRNRPYRIDFNTGNVALDKRTVHMMSSASPETRSNECYRRGRQDILRRIDCLSKEFGFNKACS